jgi:hypothetical protein
MMLQSTLAATVRAAQADPGVAMATNRDDPYPQQEQAEATTRLLLAIIQQARV